MLPRIVLITRKTPLEHLLERLSTVGQVRFYLESRGRRVDDFERAHSLREHALATAQAAIAPERPRVRVDRDELDRFVFRPDDVIAAVGQDGLVANVSKYLAGQLVIGINPDPETFDGVLCPHAPAAFVNLLQWLERPTTRFAVQARTMAEAVREDGQRLTALNELYFGSRSHQSARYLLTAGGVSERQSSSGALVITGTGATGWGRSVAGQRGLQSLLPEVAERRLAWFVREPFPSVSTGTDLDHGVLTDSEHLSAVSEMGEGGVIFADGIETDFLEFNEGHSVRMGVAAQTLNLVVAGQP